MTQQAGNVFLKGLNGITDGKVFGIERDEISIGRHPDCDVVIGTNTVSATHARLYKEGNFYFLEDLKSTNGSFVNDQKISAITRLRTEDTVTFDILKFKFVDNRDVIRTVMHVHDEEEAAKYASKGSLDNEPTAPVPPMEDISEPAPPVESSPPPPPSAAENTEPVPPMETKPPPPPPAEEITEPVPPVPQPVESVPTQKEPKVPIPPEEELTEAVPIVKSEAQDAQANELTEPVEPPKDIRKKSQLNIEPGQSSGNYVFEPPPPEPQRRQPPPDRPMRRPHTVVGMPALKNNPINGLVLGLLLTFTFTYGTTILLTIIKTPNFSFSSLPSMLQGIPVLFPMLHIPTYWKNLATWDVASVLLLVCITLGLLLGGYFQQKVAGGNRIKNALLFGAVYTFLTILLQLVFLGFDTQAWQLLHMGTGLGLAKPVLNLLVSIIWIFGISMVLALLGGLPVKSKRK